MVIGEVTQRPLSLIQQLVAIWERSVRETHLFLSEAAICEIREYVPDALRGVAHLVLAMDTDGQPVAFMGIEGCRLEMLFIAPEERGKGFGRALLQHGIDAFAVDELTVNEQNPLARGFYEHMGFHVYKRTYLDEQGNPYPLLYMRRDERQQAETVPSKVEFTAEMKIRYKCMLAGHETEHALVEK